MNSAIAVPESAEPRLPCAGSGAGAGAQGSFPLPQNLSCPSLRALSSVQGTPEHSHKHPLSPDFSVQHVKIPTPVLLFRGLI